MKKILFFAGMLVASLTACVENDTNISNEKLSFNLATSKSVSRAAEVTTETLEAEGGLKVESYFEDGSKFEDFTLSYSEGTGTWSYITASGLTEVYQPLVPLNYYSVVPSNGINYIVNGASTTFNYTVPEGGVTDLIGTTATSSQEDTQVDLIYTHLLSQINFAIVADNGTEVGIKDITLSGLKNSSTYTFGANVWGTLSGNASYTYVDFDNYTEVNNSGVLVGVPEGSGLMLMPQDFTTNSVDAELSFTYGVWNGNHGGEWGKESVGGVLTLKLSEFTVQTWEPGKKYLYVFKFDKNTPGLKPLTFKVEVEKWEEEQTVGIEE